MIGGEQLAVSNKKDNENEDNMNKVNLSDDSLDENKDTEENKEETGSENTTSDEKNQAADPDNEEDKNDAGRGSIFSRKDKKDKKDKKDAKIEELNDRLMRLMAEYDNYRKRTDKEKSMMFEMGAKAIVEKVLPVIDNFERGFDCVDEKGKEDPFVQGMDKIYKQMIAMLEEAGVKAIDAVGKEFDPNIHNAVMHIDDETMDTNIVAEEFQKGYMYKDSVVRCSMVKVAN